MEPTEIGRKLGVDALILGSLAQRGASLAITAELVSVRDASQLWGEKYSRRADDVLQVEGEIAATIARTLRRQLSGEEKAKLARSATSDPEAYRLYLKGRELPRGQPAGDGQERRLLPAGGGAGARATRWPTPASRRPTRARPSCARAIANEPLEKARAAVNRALELDPDLAEAHTALGLVRFYFEWDWAGAESEFRRGARAQPRQPAPSTRSTGTS